MSDNGDLVISLDPEFLQRYATQHLEWQLTDALERIEVLEMIVRSLVEYTSMGVSWQE